MGRHLWQKVYSDKKFTITTSEPSFIVQKHKDKVSSGDLVLDVGRGNGRNSIFLANQGCFVDCFDVADLKWHSALPKELKERIRFSQKDILDYKYELNKYKIIIVARIIQYLNKEELFFLVDHVSKSLQKGGYLLLSFTADGGIFNREEIHVQKHRYSIEEIKSLLLTRFSEVSIAKGATKNKHVNYEEGLLSYDISAKN